MTIIAGPVTRTRYRSATPNLCSAVVPWPHSPMIKSMFAPWWATCPSVQCTKYAACASPSCRIHPQTRRLAKPQHAQMPRSCAPSGSTVIVTLLTCEPSCPLLQEVSHALLEVGGAEREFHLVVGLDRGLGE